MFWIILIIVALLLLIAFLTRNGRRKDGCGYVGSDGSGGYSVTDTTNINFYDSGSFDHDSDASFDGGGGDFGGGGSDGGWDSGGDSGGGDSGGGDSGGGGD